MEPKLIVPVPKLNLQRWLWLTLNTHAALALPAFSVDEVAERVAWARDVLSRHGD